MLFDTACPNEKYEGTWTILCYTWLSFALVGMHIAEPLWKKISNDNKNKPFVSILGYSIICFIIAGLLTAALYFLFTRFFVDVMIVKALDIRGELVP